MPAKTNGAECAARLVVCAFAALLWLMIAAEARAEDGFGSSVEGAVAVGPVAGERSGDEQSPAGDATTEPVPDVPTPVEDPVEAPPAEQPPVEEGPPAVPSTPEQPPAESPQPQPPAPDQAPAQAPVPDQPGPNPPVPAGEAPPPALFPAPDPSVVAPPPLPDALVEPTPSGEPEAAPSGANGKRAPEAGWVAAGSRRGFAVAIRVEVLPPIAGGLATDRLGVQRGSHSETVNGTAPAGEGIGDAPLLPPAPSGDGIPSTLFLSGGGMNGGSAGGFFAGVLAGLMALAWAAAQRLGGLVPLTLAPPRRTAFVVSLERPD